MSKQYARNFRGVPERSGDAPPLASDAQPHWATARDGSSYVVVHLYPRTLDELRKLSRDYGEAAVTDVHWGCVIRWLMSAPHEIELRNPVTVANVSVLMLREHDRIRLGWPRHDGKAWDAPALHTLSHDVRQEAELVAAETHSDWERAGKPYMGRDTIKGAYKTLVACPEFIERYVRTDDNKEQE